MKTVLGVEVGGTFTDLVAFRDGNVTIAKVPSTPQSNEIGAFDAVLASGFSVDEIDDFVHGSTVATNAILERKGERVAFVTTAGFRDMLLLQRQDRRNIYNLLYRNPESIVPRQDCFEVHERVLSDGSVAVELDEARIQKELVPTLHKQGFKAVAICLLNAFANPAHERRVAELLQQGLSDVTITCSTNVVNEFREYERASTTVLSAYVQPVIAGYLARFSQWLQQKSFKGNFSIMQSNGGRLPAQAVGPNAITVLFSGPAAGVVGATRQIGRSGFRNLITFDMGGTSTDVSLVENGEFRMNTETTINGLPVRTPVLDIETVGAGGGSIVWMDEGGMLHVGPRSAGADPGPACYGKGGTQPTITDAHVVCGTIRSDTVLGGTIRIDLAAAQKAFRPLAEKLGISIEEMAEDAIKLANANIVRAIQLVSTERGRDPRDYAIVPFGGAGPLHASSVASDLDIDTVIVPPSAGVISAYGLLASDFVKYESRTYRVLLSEDAIAPIAQIVDNLRTSLSGQFGEMGLSAPSEWGLTLDMRFVGQAFEVAVDLGSANVAELSSHDIRTKFLEAHERIYFRGRQSRNPVEIVSIRVVARNPAIKAPHLIRDAAACAKESYDDARLYFNGRWQHCLRLNESALQTGNEIVGPTIIEGATTTILVPVAWTAMQDSNDNLILSRNSQ